MSPHASRAPTRVARRLGPWALARGSLLAALLACYADPGYQGRSSGEWIAQLHEPSADRRADAAYALSHVLALQPDDRAAVAALVRALADTSDAVRVASAGALTEAARGGRRTTQAVLPGAVVGLATLLTDSAHATVRAEAARVLGALGAAAVAGGGAPVLGGALRDANPDVRRTALDGLAALGPTLRPAWPALDTALVGAAGRDPAPGNRRAALAALAAVRTPSALLVPALVRATSDVDAGVRETAVRTLGLLGATTDAAARAVLTRALSDQDATVREEARHALTALHRRGGDDPAPPEPSPLARCARSGNQGPGC